MQVIVEKMIDYLRNVSDEVIKADVVQRIGELVERFAPDTQWFIDTMNQVGPMGGPRGDPKSAATCLLACTASCSGMLCKALSSPDDGGTMACKHRSWSLLLLG